MVTTSYLFIFFKGEDLPVARVIPNKTASYGDMVRLYCNMTHKNNESTTPITKVTFLKNDIPVRQTHEITQPLILAGVTPSDGGVYSCQISVLLSNVQPYNVTPTTTAYVHGKSAWKILTLVLTKKDLTNAYQNS